MTEIVYCEIDAENRVIIVPQSEKLLGVESDEKGQRKYFKCPKIVGDNIDLSKSTIYISMYRMHQVHHQEKIDILLKTLR